MEIVLIIVVSAINMACFFIGAKLGQAIQRGEELKVPVAAGPIAWYKAHREAKQEEMEKDRLNTILANIDRYDGTGNGQEDVPR